MRDYSRYKTLFNEPSICGQELAFIREAIEGLHWSGNGKFTRRCEKHLESTWSFDHALLTNSCTGALEMAAILCDIHPGDEVIMPSYTFVSTANAFVLRGAKIIFADSAPDSPHIDVSQLDSLITRKTRAIVPVHYGGVACEMAEIIQIAEAHDLMVIEDAAQALGSTYHGQSLGGLGDLGTFSFHQTKSISCGEGGALAVNNASLLARAEVIREKGTDRSLFFRGEVEKYGWMDIGSSYLPSEITAALLLAQLKCFDKLVHQRVERWDMYHAGLQELHDSHGIQLPIVPSYCTHSGGIYYLVCRSRSERDGLMDALAHEGVLAVFHYLPLHQSPYYQQKHLGGKLDQAVRYGERLVRLPLYPNLPLDEVERIVGIVKNYFDG